MPLQCRLQEPRPPLAYEVRRQKTNPLQYWAIFYDTQEPIIPKEQWERVQELRQNKRRNTISVNLLHKKSLSPMKESSAGISLILRNYFLINLGLS